MSHLKTDKNLWSSIVPVAFHVDYWDYIGWKDRFALPVYSERQRRHARSGNISTVYTPGFVFNGEEWRGWFRGKQLATRPGKVVGKLRIDIIDGQTRVTFSPVEQLSHQVLDLHVAILGFDLTTEVAAGENRGRNLAHDFVVLAFARTVIEQDAQIYHTEFVLPVSELNARVVALAAWVGPRDDGVPIQAVGGWLAGVDSD